MILSTSNELIDVFVKSQGIQALEGNLFFQNDKNTIQQTLWALSNIGAGTDTHIQSLISNNQVICKLMSMMESFYHSISRESTIVITNMIVSAIDKEIIYNLLVQNEFKMFKILVYLLKINDNVLLKELLSSMNVIFKLDY
jgi:hypothetical protein